MAVLSATGTSGAVEVLIPTDRTQLMHNLEVDAVHTYFVGAGQWAVHNGCPPNSISNLDGQGKEAIRESMDAIQPADGAGWTGAYDMETNSFVAIPSDPSATFLRGSTENPPGIVARQGGHGAVANVLVRELGIDFREYPNRFVGFHLSYPADNILEVGWKSNALNTHGTEYTIMLPGAGYVKPEYQESIMNVMRGVLPEGVTLNNLGIPGRG
ncbi:hypothetical protein HC928_10405 [bacterium]|nr:hypothetical protein [bacterium]